MADLTIQSLIDNKFTNIENTPEAIRQAASFILENWKGLGQTSPKGWAQTALVKLDMVDEARAKIAAAESGTDSTIKNPEAVIAQEQAKVDKYLGEAYQWITGDAQPTRKKSVISRAKDTIADLNEKIANLSSNIANVTDFSNPDISEEEKARLTAKAETMSREMDDLLSMGTSYGIDTTGAQNLVRTASGYIPASDATLQQRTLREGQTTTVRQGIDGKWDVVGADGTILQTGIGSQAEALAIQQQQQGGSTPGVSGRADLYTTNPVLPEEQAAIDAGTARVATPEELAAVQNGTLPTAAAEQAATGGTNGSASQTELANAFESSVSSSESAALAANPNLQITPEMRAEWVAEAYDELRNNRYYQEVIRNAEFDLGQSMNRLVEDTRQRELSLAQQYKENLQGTQDNLQARGMLYGGVRNETEQTLADKTNLGFDQLGSQFRQGLEDLSQTGSRYFGTDYSQYLAPQYGNTQSVGRVLPGQPIYQTGEDTALFKPQEGQYGSLPRELTAEAQYRAGEKETAFGGATSESY